MQRSFCKSFRDDDRSKGSASIRVSRSGSRIEAEAEPRQSRSLAVLPACAIAYAKGNRCGARRGEAGPIVNGFLLSAGCSQDNENLLKIFCAFSALERNDANPNNASRLFSHLSIVIAWHFPVVPSFFAIILAILVLLTSSSSSSGLGARTCWQPMMMILRRRRCIAYWQRCLQHMAPLSLTLHVQHMLHILLVRQGS